MATETDFLNGALGLIGTSAITGIDDGTVNANWCKTFYPKLRQAYLRQHHWNFAEARRELAQAATAPAFEFAYAYALPPELLKIKEYNGDLPDTSAVDPAYWTTYAGRYKIEGRQLLTNDSVVKIVYIQDIIDPELWDSMFYQALEAHLASKLARAISHDTAKAQSLLNEAVSVIGPIAMAVDGQEGTILPYRVDDLTWGR